jgi:putative MATE family efflux protein
MEEEKKEAAEDSKATFTGGHLFKKMVLFALPILLISLLQLVFYSVDQLIVANFGGGQISFAAVSSNNAIINLLIGSFLGVSVGANIVLAKAIGSKDEMKAQRIIQSAMLLSLILGFSVAIIGVFIAPYLLTMMATPESVIASATVYLRCCFGGMPFLMIFNFGAACLRARGDAKKPFYILAFSGSLNVCLNLLFVLGFGMKDEGRDVLAVGLATLISQVVEAFLTCLCLYRSKSPYTHLAFKGLGLYKEESLDVLKNGLPAGLQFFIFSISNVLIQASVNAFSNGEYTRLEAMNGNAASLQLESYISMVLKAFGVAVMAMAAQNYGAGNKKNLKTILWLSLVTTTAISLLMAGMAVIFYKPLLGLFLPQSAFKGTDASEQWAKSIEVGHKRLLLIGLCYFVDAWMDNTAAYCRAIGHPFAPTLVTFFSVTVYRLIFILALWNNIPELHTLEWLWSTWPISWALAVITYWCFMPHYLKKAFREIDAKNVQIAARPQ